jgi:DNA-binding LacI/PurR family transcriptional regulator
MLEAGVPLVAFDRAPGDLAIDSVQITNAQAAAQAVNHLIQDGHRRIALITGTRTVATAIDRKTGYEQALQAAGLPVDPALIHFGDYVREGGYKAMQALMASPMSPTAVLVADTGMTLGAIQRLNELGLEIPRDLSLITFDDMPWATAIRPPLTVVAQPANEIGVVAAKLMLDRIREPESATKHVTLEARLIVRSSCSCSIDKSQHPAPKPARIPGQRRANPVGSR